MYTGKKKSSSKIASWACGTPKEMPGKGRALSVPRVRELLWSLFSQHSQGSRKLGEIHQPHFQFLEFGSTCSHQDFAHVMYIHKTKLLKGNSACASRNVVVNQQPDLSKCPQIAQSKMRFQCSSVASNAECILGRTPHWRAAFGTL